MLENKQFTPFFGIFFFVCMLAYWPIEYNCYASCSKILFLKRIGRNWKAFLSPETLTLCLHCYWLIYFIHTAIYCITSWHLFHHRIINFILCLAYQSHDMALDYKEHRVEGNSDIWCFLTCGNIVQSTGLYDLVFIEMRPTRPESNPWPSVQQQITINLVPLKWATTLYYHARYFHLPDFNPETLWAIFSEHCASVLSKLHVCNK